MFHSPATGTPTSLIYNQESELKIDCTMGHELVPIVTMSTTTGIHQHQYHPTSLALPEMLDNVPDMPQYENTGEAVMLKQMDVFQQPTSVVHSPPTLTGVYPLEEECEELEENEM